YFDREEEAQEYRDLKIQALKRLVGRTMGDAIEGYEQYLEEKGTVAISRKETARRLRVFFSQPGELVTRLDHEKAKQLYAVFRQRRRPDGQPISVAYHRSALIHARSLFGWLIDQGCVKTNPFAGVKGVGRRNAGKCQLTGDETRRFYAYCLVR